MSHALHRDGTATQLQNDYTFYARASRFVNREGCGPKLRKILSIALEQGKKAARGRPMKDSNATTLGDLRYLIVPNTGERR